MKPATIVPATHNRRARVAGARSRCLAVLLSLLCGCHAPTPVSKPAAAGVLAPADLAQLSPNQIVRSRAAEQQVEGLIDAGRAAHQAGDTATAIAHFQAARRQLASLPATEMATRSVDLLLAAAWSTHAEQLMRRARRRRRTADYDAALAALREVQRLLEAGSE